MFAVVQHDQGATIGDEPQQRIQRRSAGLVGQAERPNHGNWHHIGVGERREVDVPDLVIHAGRYTHGKACLADTTRTGQGHQPVIGQETTHFFDLLDASHEAREVAWKSLCANHIRGTQWRKFVADIRMAQLDDLFRPREVTQCVGPEIGEPGVGRQVIDHHRLRRTRQHGLATMRQVAQACRAVDRRAHVVALVTQLDLAGIQSDSQPYRR